MPLASKRPRDEDVTSDFRRVPHRSLDESDPDGVLPPRKVAKVSPKTDFSKFEIGRALDLPSVLPGPPPPQVNAEAADGEPPTETANSAAGLPDSETPSQAGGTSGDLIKLLDLSQLDSMSSIETRFEQIASELLHNYRIEVKSAKGTEQLEVLEVEFYLYKTGCHEDPFTHASPEQSQRGRWYFHRPPARLTEPRTPTTVIPNGYRGGTRKGLDVTLGRAPPAMTSKFFPPPSSSSDATSSEGTDIVRGGALLRSARRVSDRKVISGPSLLVDEFLRLSGAKEIAELVAINWNGDISAFPPPDAPSPSSSSVLDTTRQLKQLPASMTGLSPARLSTMYFVRAPPASDGAGAAGRAPTSDPFKDALADGRLRIFRSPRIGLDISHPSVPSPSSSPSSVAQTLAHPRVAFVAQPYRFFVSPHLLAYNGRGQSFVGVHDALRCAGDAELLAELVRLTGIKGPTAARYLVELRAGRADGALGEWAGPKGKAGAASVTGWLRMIGTLRRLGVGGGKLTEQEGVSKEEETKTGY